ncbi:MAG: hypothetical protein ACRDRH_03780 [Pseudonocardia sp.]
MSPTFIGTMFVAILLLAYWRLTLMVLAAALLAAVAIGLGLVPDDVAASAERSSPSVEQPVDPTAPIPPALRAEPLR